MRVATRGHKVDRHPVDGGRVPSYVVRRECSCSTQVRVTQSHGHGRSPSPASSAPELTMLARRHSEAKNRRRSSAEALAGWKKLVYASPGRRSRFHTLRGELVPWGELLRLPLRVASRLAGMGRTDPWLAPAAVAFLRSSLPPRACILEFGAGASTPWLAKRAGYIHSFESAADWFEEVRRTLEGLGLTNWSLDLEPATRFPVVAGRFDSESFDLVVVDCAEDETGSLRLACARAASPLVRAGGMLLFDNSDRAQYRELDALFSHWDLHRFSGIAPEPLTPTETSVYVRPR